MNISTATDFYKTGHIFQFPDNSEYMLSNMTARSSKNAGIYESEYTILFGLTAYIKEFLIDVWNRDFFNKPINEVLKPYKRRMDSALGPDAVTVDHIADLHKLGYLPIEIRALPEGSKVPIKVPYFTIDNTSMKFAWVVNYLETPNSAELWKPITVATIAYKYRKTLMKYVKRTGSNVDFARWQLHDFSMRGMSGIHDSSVCGAAHLAMGNYGTDTIPAIDRLEKYYNADVEKELVGGSVPATEHSVMCMGGKETERDTIKRLITKIYPSGVVSIVSDTWDFWHVITVTAPSLKEEILSRTPDGLGLAKVVFRPDSGDPVKIVSGMTSFKMEEFDSMYEGYDYPYMFEESYDVVEVNGKFYNYSLEYDTDYDGYHCNHKILPLDEVPVHEVKGAVECLWDTFGGTVNEKGYKTLNQRVGLIYGDSITLKRAEDILSRLADKGFAADNIVFGVGSYTYQYITRDTYGIAVKATFGVVDTEDRELFKDPATDNGTKKSAKGRLFVGKKEDGTYYLEDQVSGPKFHSEDNQLKVVFSNGKLIRDTTLNDIRNLVDANLAAESD